MYPHRSRQAALRWTGCSTHDPARSHKFSGAEIGRRIELAYSGTGATSKRGNRPMLKGNTVALSSIPDKIGWRPSQCLACNAAGYRGLSTSSSPLKGQT